MGGNRTPKKATLKKKTLSLQGKRQQLFLIKYVLYAVGKTNVKIGKKTKIFVFMDILTNFLVVFPTVYRMVNTKFGCYMLLGKLWKNVEKIAKS